MWKWIIAGLIALSYVTGIGNYVSALIYRVNGTWSTAYVDGTGEAVAATMGPNAPLPAWLPRPPGSVIVTASHSYMGPQRRQFATLDFATRMSKTEIDRFYIEHLQAEGFKIVERDADVLEPLLAGILGVDGMLIAAHSEKDWRVKVSIRSSSGWILPSRIVQVYWWDWPMAMGSRPQAQPPQP